MPTEDELKATADSEAAATAAREREVERAALAKERDDAKAEAERVRSEAAAREAQWQDHMTRLAQQQQASQQHQPPQQEAFGDDDLLTGKQFKLAAANLMSTLAGATQQEIVKIHKTQRASNREHARSRLANFSKYEKDVEEYLDRVPVEVASNPAVYDEAYRLARAKHVDEDVAAGTEAAALRRAREILESKGLDPADFGLDAETTASAGPAATAPASYTPSRVDSPSMPGNATPRPAVSVRTTRQPGVKLNQQQAYIANRFGISADDFVKYGDDETEHDFLGAKGRPRI